MHWLHNATDVAVLTAKRTNMEMHRRDVIGVQIIAHVNSEWKVHSREWDRKTGWPLFSIATHALSGKVIENPPALRRCRRSSTSYALRRCGADSGWRQISIAYAQRRGATWTSIGTKPLAR